MNYALIGLATSKCNCFFKRLLDAVEWLTHSAFPIEYLVGRRGFEPLSSGLKDRHPRPLDERPILAEGPGFEPGSPGSEPGIMGLYTIPLYWYRRWDSNPQATRFELARFADFLHSGIVDISAAQDAAGVVISTVLVLRDGIEPPTPCSSGRRSTTELPKHMRN